MHPDQNLELFLRRRSSLRVHELRQLIRRAEVSGSVKAIREGVVGREVVSVPFLLTGPVEELRRDGGVVAYFQNLGDGARRDAAEFVQLRDDGGAPVVLVLAEGVEDEARDRG